MDSATFSASAAGRSGRNRDRPPWPTRCRASRAASAGPERGAHDRAELRDHLCRAPCAPAPPPPRATLARSAAGGARSSGRRRGGVEPYGEPARPPDPESRHDHAEQAPRSSAHARAPPRPGSFTSMEATSGVSSSNSVAASADSPAGGLRFEGGEVPELRARQRLVEVDLRGDGPDARARVQEPPLERVPGGELDGPGHRPRDRHLEDVGELLVAVAGPRHCAACTPTRRGPGRSPPPAGSARAAPAGRGGLPLPANASWVSASRRRGSANASPGSSADGPDRVLERGDDRLAAENESSLGPSPPRGSASASPRRRSGPRGPGPPAARCGP